MGRTYAVKGYHCTDEFTITTDSCVCGYHKCNAICDLLMGIKYSTTVRETDNLNGPYDVSVLKLK